MADTTEKREPRPKKTFADFLESAPPDTVEQVSNLFVVEGIRWLVAKPDIQLYCSSKPCEGVRFFRCTGSTNSMVVSGTPADVFMDYNCRNCRQTSKTFALLVLQESDNSFGQAMKYGEQPSFGPPVPARVISLIGPDREMFLRGRRSENHGLGIGAFAYFRRVVENQKGRIIGEIGKVAERLGAGKDVLLQFQNAANETQFSKAIDQIKAAFPDSLLIDGHNPLKLLHSALSEGMHAQTDEECLQIAQDIRLVLTELADRISQALKDEAELKQAVSRLLKRKAADPSGTGGANDTSTVAEADTFEQSRE